MFHHMICGNKRKCNILFVAPDRRRRRAPAHLFSSLLLYRYAAVRHIAPPFIPNLLQKLPLRHLLGLDVFLNISMCLFPQRVAALKLPDLFDTLSGFRDTFHCPLLLYNQPVDSVLRAGRMPSTVSRIKRMLLAVNKWEQTCSSCRFCSALIRACLARCNWLPIPLLPAVAGRTVECIGWPLILMLFQHEQI